MVCLERIYKNVVNDTNTIDSSCYENVSGPSETSLNTSKHSELSLPKYSDNPKKVAGRFVSEL
jgi:hypothetical protein